MQHESRTAAQPGSSNLRLIGLLLIVCFGLLAMRATQVALGLLDGDTKGVQLAESGAASDAPDSDPSDDPSAPRLADATENPAGAARQAAAADNLRPSTNPAATKDRSAAPVANDLAARPSPVAPLTANRAASIESLPRESPEEALSRQALTASVGRMTTAGQRWSSAAQHQAASLASTFEQPITWLREMNQASSKATMRPERDDPEEDHTAVAIPTPRNEAAPVALVNSAEGTVHFLLNDEVRTLEPGEFQLLKAGGPWTIRFHRGSDFGDASTRLDRGVHEFAVTEDGWELRPRASQ